MPVSLSVVEFVPLDENILGESHTLCPLCLSPPPREKNPNNQQETANKNTPDDSRSKVKVLFSRENSVGKYNPSKENSGRVVPKNALK